MHRGGIWNYPIPTGAFHVITCKLSRQIRVFKVEDIYWLLELWSTQLNFGRSTRSMWVGYCVTWCDVLFNTFQLNAQQLGLMDRWIESSNWILWTIYQNTHEQQLFSFTNLYIKPGSITPNAPDDKPYIIVCTSVSTYLQLQLIRGGSIKVDHGVFDSLQCRQSMNNFIEAREEIYEHTSVNVFRWTVDVNLGKLQVWWGVICAQEYYNETSHCWILGNEVHDLKHGTSEAHDVN